MTRRRAGVSKRNWARLLLALVCVAPMLLAQQRPAPPSEVSTSPPPARESRDDVDPRGLQGCPTLPQPLAGKNIEDWLEYLTARGIRHQKSEEASIEPEGVILGEPTTESEAAAAMSTSSSQTAHWCECPTCSTQGRPEVAERRLAGKDLRIRLVRTPSNEPVNTVIAQNPLPELEVKRGSVVEVSIAVPDLIDLPDVIGMPFDRAEVVLFGFAVRPSRVASVRPEGEVIGQRPRPSGPTRLPRRTEVQLEISDGSLVVVPQIEGELIDEARAVLERVGLIAEPAREEHPSASDTVVSQEPRGGASAERGSTVRVVVSDGIAVPDVVGRSIYEARTLLARFEVREAPAADVASQGKVVSQTPPPQTRRAEGSVVELKVSDGSRVAVPEVTNRPVAAARALLEDAGLVMNPTSQEDPSAPDTVVAQDPKADSIVARGETVRVAVSTGIAVPDVVQRPLKEARVALERFDVEAVNVPGAPPAEVVLAQKPQAGERVAAGARIQLDVSNGSVVPDNAEDGGNDGTPPPPPGDRGPPLWAWLLGGLTAAVATGLRVRRSLQQRKLVSQMSYRASLETEPDSLRISAVEADGPVLRMAARLESGESTVRFDGDAT
jgi:beta-lactam-binding protein with PASTA domain